MGVRILSSAPQITFVIKILLSMHEGLHRPVEVKVTLPTELELTNRIGAAVSDLNKRVKNRERITVRARLYTEVLPELQRLLEEQEAPMGDPELAEKIRPLVMEAGKTLTKSVRTQVEESLLDALRAFRVEFITPPSQEEAA